jgi:DNA-binding NarL/FixJ family response regulator
MLDALPMTHMTHTPRLTPRERQIVRLVAAACTNVEIAAELGSRPQTVKNQLTEIYDKLGLRNRTALALWHIAHDGTGD